MAIKISRGDSLDRFYLIKLFGFGVFLHRIHHSDPPRTFHSHPWNGVSLIFGNYWEEFADEARPNKDGSCVFGAKHHPRKWFNRVKANRHHRTVVDKPTWTLFFHGRKCNQWSVIKDGKSVQTPWENAEGHKSYSKALNTLT